MFSPACRLAAAAVLPAATASAPAAVAQAAQSRLLHPVVTRLPSLLGWQPCAPGAAPLHLPWLGGSAVQRLATACAATGFSTLSNSISLTPAIESQLARIQQRHADLLRQLSGDAMSK